MTSLTHGHQDSLKGVKFRYEVLPRDVEDVRNLVEKTGFFRGDEIAVAAELVTERLSRGPESGYHFVMAEEEGRLTGYVCYGPIPCTISSYDLYWIAVDPRLQGRGLGKALLYEAERLIKKMGGDRVYVETSSRAQYKSTRIFYEQCGYSKASVLDDFYGPGDSKATYLKLLPVHGNSTDHS
jgi:ribosomal protein S18 acetylase RimI-like enzyme